MKIDCRKKIHHVANEHIILQQAGEVSDMTKVVAFNDTALELYEAMKDKEFSVDDVVNYLVAQFDVEPSVAKHDAEAWLAQMREHGLLAE